LVDRILDKKHLQQRIVGAIVLVALGVIFIPIILSQGDDVSPITGSNIPVKPVELTQLREQKPPQRPQVVDVDRSLPQLVDEHTPPVSQIDTSPVDNVANSTSKPEAKPTSAEKPKTDKKTDKPERAKKPKSAKPRAWVVQVASFAERKKALKLRDRLKKAKHPTFVESVNGKNGLLYRVRVGPLVKRAKADKLKLTIVKQFNFKDALVMAHPK